MRRRDAFVMRIHERIIVAWGDRGAMDKTPAYQSNGFSAVGSSLGLGGLVSLGKKLYPQFPTPSDESINRGLF